MINIERSLYYTWLSCSRLVETNVLFNLADSQSSSDTVIGIQNIEQIYHSYGPELARSILSGFLTQVSFRVNHFESKNYINNIYGSNRKNETFTSAVASHGIVEQIRDASVVEDWDISKSALGEAIIGLPNNPPFLFKFKRFK